MNRVLQQFYKTWVLKSDAACSDPNEDFSGEEKLEPVIESYLKAHFMLNRYIYLMKLLLHFGWIRCFGRIKNGEMVRGSDESDKLDE